MTQIELSQHQKILTLMLRAVPQDRWFFPYDFMPPRLTFDNPYCVGYEAGARLSELGNDFPEIIESQRDGKYIKRRVKFDQLIPNLHKLPKDLRYVVHRAGLTANVQKVKQADKVIYKQKPTEQSTLIDVPPVKPKRELML